MKKRRPQIIGRINGRPVFEVSGGHDVFGLTQQSFRLRNDDGSETTATWKYAADINAILPVDTNFRIRFLVQESGTGTAAGTFGGQLQYRKNGGTWTNVTASSSNVKAVASANIADGVATTQQLGSGTFVAGSIDEVDGNVSDVSLSGDDETEVEYVLQLVSTDLATQDIIELRVIGQGDDTTVLDAYTVIPKILPEDVFNEDFATSPGWNAFGDGDASFGDSRSQSGGFIDVTTSGGGDGYWENFGGNNTGAPVAVKEAWAQFDITFSDGGARSLDSGEHLVGTGFAFSGVSNNRFGFGVGNFGSGISYQLHPQENSPTDGRDIEVTTYSYVDGKKLTVTLHLKAATGPGANDGKAEAWIFDNKVLNAQTEDSDELTIDSFAAGSMNASHANGSFDINIDVDNVWVGITQPSLPSETVTRTKTTSLDAIIQKQGVVKTASLNAILQKQDITKTASLDAVLQALGLTKTSSLDAVLQALGVTKTVSLDSILLALGVQKTVSLDAVLSLPAVTRTKTVSLDSILQLVGATKTVSVDAILQALGVTKTASLDAVLLALGITKTVSVDAVLQALGVQKTVSFDAILLALGVTKTVSFDAVLSSGAAAQTKTTSLDAILRAEALTKQVSFDALLQSLGLTKIVSIDAILQAAGLTKTVSLDAVLLGLGVTKTVSFDAVLQALGITRGTSLDALLQAAGLTRTASLDAILLALGATKTTTVDAILLKTNIPLTASFDAILIPSGSYQAVLGVDLEVVRSVAEELEINSLVDTDLAVTRSVAMELEVISNA